MFKIYSIVIALMLAGCATPAQHFADTAAKYGFTSTNIVGQPFEHRIYTNQLANQAPQDSVLHVYLDGDGTPWQNENWPAQDPTSRNPLILSLMAEDKAPSLLLGRPCYHGLNTSKLCDDRLWTSKRYAREIVDSMTVALNNWLQKHPFKKVALIGHSGGGTLAVLMADKVFRVETVLTFCANLDVDGWSKALNYPVLSESLNPIKEKKLPVRIKQIHLAGGEDQVVPARIVKSYADQQENAQYHVFADFDHQCCWQAEWQKILRWF